MPTIVLSLTGYEPVSSKMKEIEYKKYLYFETARNQFFKVDLQ